MTVSLTLCDSSRALIHGLLWMRDRDCCGIRKAAANGVESHPSQEPRMRGAPTVLLVQEKAREERATGRVA